MQKHEHAFADVSESSSSEVRRNIQDRLPGLNALVKPVAKKMNDYWQQLSQKLSDVTSTGSENTLPDPQSPMGSLAACQLKVLLLNLKSLYKIMSSIAVSMGCDVPEGLGQMVNIAATTLDVSASCLKLQAFLIDGKLDPTKELGRLERATAILGELFGFLQKLGDSEGGDEHVLQVVARLQLCGGTFAQELVARLMDT